MNEQQKLRLLFSRSDEPIKKATLIIPVYNEEHNLKTLAMTLDKTAWPLPTEWIFINDGSTDQSAAVLDSIKKQYRSALVLHHEKNKGKGAAIRTGVKQASGDLLAIQDADLEYTPSELANLMLPIINEEADVVYGSRFKKNVTQVHRTFHMMINRILTHISNLFSGIYLSDMESCYKVFRSDILKSFRLESNRFGIEAEMTAYIAKFSLRIVELPISYFPRRFDEGKKIGFWDGLAALWFIMKYNWFVSTKGCLNKRGLAKLSEPFAQSS